MYNFLSLKLNPVIVPEENFKPPDLPPFSLNRNVLVLSRQGLALMYFVYSWLAMEICSQNVLSSRSKNPTHKRRSSLSTPSISSFKCDKKFFWSDKPDCFLNVLCRNNENWYSTNFSIYATDKGLMEAYLQIASSLNLCSCLGICTDSRGWRMFSGEV